MARSLPSPDVPGVAATVQNGCCRSGGSGGLAPVAVAEAADRLDNRVLAHLRAELAAQPHDAVLHAVGADTEGVAPGQLEQLDRGQYLSAVPDEGGEEPELGGGQLDGNAVREYRVGDEVDLYAAVVEDLRQRVVGVVPAQQCLHAGNELGVAERLGEVVVRPAPQAAHFIGLTAVRGKHEHGNLAQLAYALQDRPPVHLGQSDVRPFAVKGAQPFPAVGGHRHVETAPVEHGADAERDVGVVLDY